MKYLLFVDPYQHCCLECDACSWFGNGRGVAGSRLRRNAWNVMLFTVLEVGWEEAAGSGIIKHNECHAFSWFAKLAGGVGRLPNHEKCEKTMHFQGFGSGYGGVGRPQNQKKYVNWIECVCNMFLLAGMR